MTSQRIVFSLVAAGTLVGLTAGVGAQDDSQQAPAARRYARIQSGQAQEVVYQALLAQGRRGGGAGGAEAGTDPMTGPVVTNAPYTADAVTTVTQILGDGTRIEQRVTARFYRDSAGRVRREQTVIGLTAEPQTTVTITPEPGTGTAYALDANARTARRVGVGGARIALRTAAGDQLNYFAANEVTWTTGLGLQNSAAAVRLPQPAPGSKPTEESLGTRQIEGVKATGRKSTSTIPAGQIGNDRPIVITDERWESQELKQIVLSRFHDPRTGDVEFQLTNINRREPPADLFQVPADYTILGGERGGGGGARSGGAGGRGAPAK
ncbi:MAG TPA: hypothetical protein VFO58_18285 [Vicinamibacterales bacterium]|nr:hypothetical protein [Vicinamibacterales bacterium]